MKRSNFIAAISLAISVLFAAAWVESALSGRRDDVRWLYEPGPSYGLRFEQTQYGYVLAVPHWLPIFATAALAVILAPSAVSTFAARMWLVFIRAGSSLKRFRVSRRFSLRTLLAATTIVALSLGVIAASLR
jgi:hypothetical protein